MSLHSILGYAAVALAGLGFILALAALLTRSHLLDRLMFGAFLVCAALQVPAIITGVLDNAHAALPALLAAPYNVFLSASQFTLTAALATWRGVNPGVVWDQSKWLIYQAAALGNLLLGIVLAVVGRMAVANG